MIREFCEYVIVGWCIGSMLIPLILGMAYWVDRRRQARVSQRWIAEYRRELKDWRTEHESDGSR